MNTMKAVRKTSDELRVANHLVIFNHRDLEGIASRRKNRDGSTGEYFTKATVFDSPYTQIGALHVDFEHAMDVLGADDVLGYVDWKTAKVDERGLFVERVLNRRNQYVKWLEELIEAGLVSNSSEAVPAGVKRADDGRIITWPLKRDSLTVTPMQSLHLTENTLAAAKALARRANCKNAWQLVQSHDATKAAKVLRPHAKVYDETEVRKMKLELELLALEVA